MVITSTHVADPAFEADKLSVSKAVSYDSIDSSPYSFSSYDDGNEDYDGFVDHEEYLPLHKDSKDHERIVSRLNLVQKSWTAKVPANFCNLTIG